MSITGLFPSVRSFIPHIITTLARKHRTTGMREGLIVKTTPYHASFGVTPNLSRALAPGSKIVTYAFVHVE